MISPTLKIAGALVGAGGVIAGGATGLYYLNNNKAQEENKVTTTPAKQKISALLASDNLALLDEARDESEWPKVWAKFSAEYQQTDPAGKWQIESWATKKDQTKGLPELKKLCKTNAEEEVEVNNKGKLYEEVSKYCTKSTKPSQTL